MTLGIQRSASYGELNSLCASPRHPPPGGGAEGTQQLRQQPQQTTTHGVISSEATYPLNPTSPRCLFPMRQQGSVCSKTDSGSAAITPGCVGVHTLESVLVSVRQPIKRFYLALFGIESTIRACRRRAICAVPVPSGIPRLRPFPPWRAGDTFLRCCQTWASSWACGLQPKC